MAIAKSLIKLQILCLLEKPKHGYEIIKQLEARIGKKISAAHIYPFLKQLKARGYLKEKSVMKGKKKIKIYSLTAKGKKLFKELQKEMALIIETALKNKLKVCACCGCKIYEGGIKKKIKGKTLFFCCEHCAKSCKV